MLLFAAFLLAQPLAPAARRLGHALVERAQMCEHWAGEEAYDAARRRQIDQGFRMARCDTLKRDVARFRRLHPSAPLARKASAATSWM